MKCKLGFNATLDRVIVLSYGVVFELGVILESQFCCGSTVTLTTSEVVVCVPRLKRWAPW